MRFVVGGDGDLREPLIERSAELGLARRVFFTGFLEAREVERLYAEADVYVMPSVSEPFGIAPLEALALDTPVIVSSRSGVAEALASSLKIDYGDVEDLAAKVLLLLERPALREALVKAGQAELAALRWEKSAEKLLALYAALTGRLAAPPAGGRPGGPGRSGALTAIAFYFQVHQPFRLKRYTYFDIGASHAYFDDGLNEMIAKRVAERCYLPMNALLRQAIEQTERRFRCSFSISGTALAQFERWVPEVIESFRGLVATGAVELLCETSQHSLAALADPEEFALQVETQRASLERLFGVRPTTFRNTELIIDERICRQVEDLGFSAIAGEGAEPLLGWRTPYVPYRPRGCRRLALLLRSYSFSDDIAFRFSNREWPAYPLMADTFARWLARGARGGALRRPVHGLRDLRRAPVDRHRDLRLHARAAGSGTGEPAPGVRARSARSARAWPPPLPQWMSCRSPGRSRGPTPSATSRPGSATTCSARPTRRSTSWPPPRGPPPAAGRASCTRTGASSRPRTTSITCPRAKWPIPMATCTSTSAPTTGPTTPSSPS